MKDNIEYISFLKENRTVDQARDIYNQRIEDSRKIFSEFSDDFYIRNCPVCGNEDYLNLAKFDDRYDIAQCAHCLTGYVNPTPSLEALDFYYNCCDSNKKLGSLLKNRSGKRGIILRERTDLVLTHIKALLKNKTKKRIGVLDIGCSSGTFLNELSIILKELDLNSYVDLFGIDIDLEAIKNPVNNDLNLYHSSVEDFVKENNRSFDLVMHFQLLEHLHDPFAFILSTRELLSDEGLMYFDTPNALGLDNRAIGYNEFRPLAHGIFPPMHLQAFTPQNISHFLIRANLEVKEISTPGNFDIDIVSQFLDGSSENVFGLLKSIKSKKDLAIIQKVIRNLGASSHMAVLAGKAKPKSYSSVMKSKPKDMGQNKSRTEQYLEKFDREKVLKHLITKVDPVIFDVGSNVGLSLIQFKDLWPDASIHCFEPQHECWDSLDKLAQAYNGISINKFAVGNKNEKEKEFYTHDLNSGISSFNKINLESKDSIDLSKIIDQKNKIAEYSKTINHPRKVEVRRLHDYITELGLKNINLLKLDIQSYEIDVINGLGKSLDIVDVIVSEIKFYDYYERSISFYELESLLNPFGFRLYDISHISKNPMNGRTDWVDVIYVK